MKLKGPLVTLVAGAAVAAGLLAANLGTTGGDDTTTAVAASTPAASTPSATVSPSPSATASATPSASVAPAALPAVATYAGKVDAGGSLSIVVKGKTVIAYLCDGTNESWLWGVVDGAGVSAKNKAGDSLEGTRGGGKVAGSLTVNGKTWSYTLPTVKKPSGLYRATAKIRGASVVGGWVVLPDGTQVGLLTVDGVPRPAPSIDASSGAVTIDGTQVTAEEPDEGDLPSS